MRAIEEKLARLRRDTGDDSLDVSLVVGTSGGAINALPVAMGMSGTPDQCDELDAVWRSLDQREIIRPAFAVRLNMALWFASVQFLILSWICRQRRNDTGRTGRVRWLLCLAAGALGVLLVHSPLDPWRLLGPRPGMHRLYLWLSFGAEGAGWLLIATGCLGMALRTGGAEVKPRLLAFRRLVRIAALAGLVVLPLLQTWTILVHEPTLSEGQGIEDTLLDRYSRLVEVRRRAGGVPGSTVPSPDEGASRREALQALSRRILGEGLLTRDLVLTDARTREQAMLFSVGPRPPHIGLLDFASNLIEASLVKGYREVKGDSWRGADQPPPFLKEVGVPHFVSLPAPDDDARRASR
jgi:hypothetical protein